MWKGSKLKLSTKLDNISYKNIHNELLIIKTCYFLQMEAVRKWVMVCRFWWQIFIESFRVDVIVILVKFLNSVQYKVKSLLFIPSDEKLTFQHCFASLAASATRDVFWPPFWCQKGPFSTPSGKMCISQRGRNVVIVALSGQQRWTREILSFVFVRIKFRYD